MSVGEILATKDFREKSIPYNSLASSSYIKYGQIKPCNAKNGWKVPVLLPYEHCPNNACLILPKWIQSFNYLFLLVGFKNYLKYSLNRFFKSLPSFEVHSPRFGIWPKLDPHPGQNRHSKCFPLPLFTLIVFHCNGRWFRR